MSRETPRVGPGPRPLPGIPPIIAAAIITIVITILLAAGYSVSHPAQPTPSPVPRDRVVLVHVQLPTAAATERGVA